MEIQLQVLQARWGFFIKVNVLVFLVVYIKQECLCRYNYITAFQFNLLHHISHRSVSQLTLMFRHTTAFIVDSVVLWMLEPTLFHLIPISITNMSFVVDYVRIFDARPLFYFTNETILWISEDKSYWYTYCWSINNMVFNILITITTSFRPTQ